MQTQQMSAADATLALWYVTNTSLVSFYKLTTQFGDAKAALAAGVDAWRALGVHTAHIKRYADTADVQAFVARVWREVAAGSYGVLFVNDAAYPQSLTQIYDPPPVLFYRGNVARLSERQIAIVGSRNPTPHAEKITFDLAQYLVQAGYGVTSGLAQGVDKQAHLGALAQLPSLSGRTVGVMGTGIDVCYPRNHNALFAQIVADGGCLVTELLPATPASKHTFPRRNRLVAGLSVATVVTEAALQSGSLITARLSAEQGKQVFAVPSLIDNANAEGCHHLIREGATLIYHPEQILEDVRAVDGAFNALPKTFAQGVSMFSETAQAAPESPKSALPQPELSKKQPSQATSSAPTKLIPEHLQAIFGQMPDAPCDLDFLVMATGKSAGELLAALLELEIIGVVQNVGGRYAKC